MLIDVHNVSMVALAWLKKKEEQTHILTDCHVAKQHTSLLPAYTQSILPAFIYMCTLNMYSIMHIWNFQFQREPLIGQGLEQNTY